MYRDALLGAANRDYSGTVQVSTSDIRTILYGYISSASEGIPIGR